MDQLNIHDSFYYQFELLKQELTKFLNDFDENVRDLQTSRKRMEFSRRWMLTNLKKYKAVYLMTLAGIFMFSIAFEWKMIWVMLTWLCIYNTIESVDFLDKRVEFGGIISETIMIAIISEGVAVMLDIGGIALCVAIGSLTFLAFHATITRPGIPEMIRKRFERRQKRHRKEAEDLVFERLKLENQKRQVNLQIKEIVPIIKASKETRQRCKTISNKIKMNDEFKNACLKRKLDEKELIAQVVDKNVFKREFARMWKVTPLNRVD
ncbi:hypothetical protein EIN_417390 [Entamoeba invadens IP1]|uniref:PRA1 family protein n=1 Tax=Entamoeba invadens IP1 TaxID=370355 RepID=A0A0A1TUD7_ENTIV|nr:hypothetical protein EIN_417390 [Entamoeba invadens IP1]ELP83630.1 hypothetical protein EIN_417390 [Entamoeba invadens IP1]|eukprot:XP_004182976.1 hypothetical protein EIN_417390 [Entamoeba invadens IP1]